MPATLAAQPLSAGPVRSSVDVFGDADALETAPRVAVQLTINLTFAEILGRLLFTPGSMLMAEDLDTLDESKILECLWFAVAQTDLGAAEDFAEMAMDIYTGRRSSNLNDFSIRLGHAITHLFGVTAPEAPGTPVPGPREVLCSSQQVGQGGMRA
ncbi:hypothetical protein GCM10010495_19650 [Kitasatospora herbaricolor]|uniref:hypothetical protein n=1 Tax=Kitasatospora herbaricolor TaxID=68217 RepID=UPI00174BEBF7|nr:hypothetical protein [Kitasatospora herbaricolor]MDQ0310450.1 hypothetical protein [Kitasatospora herbaricolor]GGV07390.1 hypothetical protein GCM10010495_19650 [Kitasatospora herbaricolor]